MAVRGEKTTHFNDWPNACGFDVRYEELEPRELEVSGEIPSYCAGVLFRNGLGPLSLETDKKIKTYRTNHWFDCLSQVHRFQIDPPTADHPKVRVTHNSRRTCDGLIERITRTGDRSGITFAAKYEPCKTFFQKLQTLFTPTSTGNGPSDAVVAVTLSPNFPGFSKDAKAHRGPLDGSGIENLYNKTDSSALQALDPETLEPLGLANQAVLHPDLKGPLAGAHAKLCPKTGDTFNYNLEFGRSGTYRAFRVSAATGACDLLATFSGPPAYIHSSLMTENYYVLCVWNSHFMAGGISMLWTRNFIDAMSDLDKKKSATWYVVDRRPPSEGGKGLVATFESDPFFAFHTINAYEEPNKQDPTQTNIVADLCAYDSLDVLKRFYIDNMRSDSTTALPYADPKYTGAKAYYRRFRLPGVNKVTSPSRDVKRVENVCHGSAGLAPELPTINHSYRGRKHRYVYGVTDTGKSTFFDGLVKYDTSTNAPCAIWSVHGQSAGEPIFIANPDAADDDEDNGVLLTGVLDGQSERTYLMVLNAKDMTEMGRATLPEGPGGLLGFGFHGAHVKANSTTMAGC